MKILRTPAELKLELQNIRRLRPQVTVGFVPTMGALHDGHKTLLQKARSENDICGLSIFVNPTQFNDPQDLSKYPKTWDSDLEMAEAIGVDFVFAPNVNEMYPDDYRYQLIEKMNSKMLCGKDRPGHFDGVLTVVMKLFNLVQPTKAYFGEKDYQQLQLIQGMVQSFFMDIEIVPVATVREATGLAMSSRNMRLNDAEREIAPLFYQTLTHAKTDTEAINVLEKNGFLVDYVQDIKGRRFGAAKLGTVRLIDNVQI